MKLWHTLKGKLTFVVMLLSAVAIVVGALGLTKMSAINKQLNEIVNVTSTKQLLAARTRQSLLAMHRAEKNLILAEDASDMNKFAEAINEYAVDIQKKVEQLLPLSDGENKKLIESFRESFDRFADVNKQIQELSRKNTNSQAMQLSLLEQGPLAADISEVLDQVETRNKLALERLLNEARTATPANIQSVLEQAQIAAHRALLGSQIRIHTLDLVRQEKNFIIEKTNKGMDTIAAAIEQAKAQLNESVDELQKIASDENKAAIATFAGLKNRWITNHGRIQALSRENSNQVAFELSRGDARKHASDAEDRLAAIADRADQDMSAVAKQSDATYAQARLLVIGTVVLGVAGGVVIAWFVILGIIRAVKQVVATIQEVSGAATELAASSEQMAAGMKEQSQQVTQISSAIEEMSASVVEVARKSGEAAQNANESGQVAEEGGAIVGQTVEGMKAINEAVSSSAVSVQELGKRGEQIGQIIEVINDIADQTNLLALNAAIEAARAGEHGRGFAVVADEVRKLADRTTKATEEIAGSIKAIQVETTDAVERMTTGTEQVKRGVELATGAGVSLQQIVDSAKDVATMIQSIAAAAEEQSAASEQVSRNVESISAVTRQSAEGATQAAAAATQLSSKAEQLRRLVGQFRLGERKAA